MGSYTPKYDTGDLTEMTVDGIGAGMVTFISFIGLIVLLLIFIFLVKIWRKLVKG